MTNPPLPPVLDPPDIFSADTLIGKRNRILVTGGEAFFGGAVVRRSLRDSEALVFNLVRCRSASDLTSIEQALQELGQHGESRHRLLRVDLADTHATAAAVQQANPDLMLHLAAESHLDRSIEGPGACIESTITGTFNLLQPVWVHWDSLPAERRELFRFHLISTYEVFGSLGATGRLSETNPYDTCSPYSASKAGSDHLVQAWQHTYGLPLVLTNCSNNYGPCQFPEKLILVVIVEAAAGELFHPSVDSQNVHDGLYVEDHVDALLVASTQTQLGHSDSVGGHRERTSKQVVEVICQQLEELRSERALHAQPITPVHDRPSHDRRNAINPTRISSEIGWQPRLKLEKHWAATDPSDLRQQDCCYLLIQNSGHSGQELRNPLELSSLTTQLAG